MGTPAEILGDLSSFIPFRTLTKVQECVIPSVLSRTENIVVAAPTGSGKTLLFEVAILKLFQSILPSQKFSARRVPSIDEFASKLSNSRCASTDSLKKTHLGKVVYVCPIKALANEKYESWTALFPHLKVVVETGDQEHYLQSQKNSKDSLHVNHSSSGSANLSMAPQTVETAISTADIILTTPERWDSITRRWKEKTVFDVVNSVSLVLLDEIHTIHEERGAALEAMVSRMMAIQAGRRIQKEGREAALVSISHDSSFSRFCTRFIAISGTLPNVSDFATWLNVPDDMIFSFTNEDRPVPLSIRICAFQSYESSNPFAFDRFLSFKLFSLVREHGEGRPCIIFCSTRSQAVSSALQVMHDAERAAEREDAHVLTQWKMPSAAGKQLAEQISDRQLRNCALVGIAFHHAALSWKDRKVVESMFRSQQIAVICTTTTLSLGVNLPAHLVIVKGTTFYNRGCSVDIPVSEVAQMCGRAGRPGLDEHGLALILTTTTKQHLYNNLAFGNTSSMTCVESQLHRHIIEHVNAEISLGTIHSFSSAITWGKTTFFWIRLKKNPSFYGLTLLTSADQLAFDAEKYLEILMTKVIDVLDKEKCITVSDYDGVQGYLSEQQSSSQSTMIDSTPLGRSMSRLYISFGTVSHFNKVLIDQKNKCRLSPFSSKEPAFHLTEALKLLSQSVEFTDLHLRQGDKCHLNKLNKAVKFPLNNGYKGGREVREDWHKVNVMIQAFIMGHYYSDMSLRNDVLRLLSSLPRVARFLKEYGPLSQSFSLSVTAEKLKVCIDHKMWEDGPILRQLSGVTEEVAHLLLQGGIRTFNDVRETNQEPHKLEAICCKPPPFGSVLIEQVSSIPIIEISVARCQNSSGIFTVKLRTTINAKWVSNELKETLDPPCSAKTPTLATSPAKSLFLEHHCTFQLLVGDQCTDVVYLSRFLSVSLLLRSENFEFQFSCPTNNSSFSIFLICDCLVGIDQEIEIQNGADVATSGSVSTAMLSSRLLASAVHKKPANCKKAHEMKPKEHLEGVKTEETKDYMSSTPEKKEILSEEDMENKDSQDGICAQRIRGSLCCSSPKEQPDAAEPFRDKSNEGDAGALQGRYSSHSVRTLLSCSPPSPLREDVRSPKGDEAILSKKISLSKFQDKAILEIESTPQKSNKAAETNYFLDTCIPIQSFSPDKCNADLISVVSPLRCHSISTEVNYAEMYRNSGENDVCMNSANFTTQRPSTPSIPSFSDNRLLPSHFTPPVVFSHSPSSAFQFCNRENKLPDESYAMNSSLSNCSPSIMTLPHKRRKIRNKTCNLAFPCHQVEYSSSPAFGTKAACRTYPPLNGCQLGSVRIESEPYSKTPQSMQDSENYLWNSSGGFPSASPFHCGRKMIPISPRNTSDYYSSVPLLSHEQYERFTPNSVEHCENVENVSFWPGSSQVFGGEAFNPQRIHEEKPFSYSFNPVSEFQPGQLFFSHSGENEQREYFYQGHKFKRTKHVRKKRRYDDLSTRISKNLNTHETQWW